MWLYRMKIRWECKGDSLEREHDFNASDGEAAKMYAQAYIRDLNQAEAARAEAKEENRDCFAKLSSLDLIERCLVAEEIRTPISI
mgnify:CR=1 FL=1